MEHIAIGEFSTLELLKHHKDSCLRIIVKNKEEKNKYLKYFSNISVDPNLINKLIKKEDIYTISYFKEYQMNIDLNKPIVVIENENDEGEIGTILRTMVAFSFFNLVLINSDVEIFSPKLIRASTGALFMCNVVKFKNNEEFLKNIHSNNIIRFKNKNAPLSLEVGAKLYKVYAASI